MSRVEPQTRFQAQDTLRPDAPNEEFEESIGEMNGRLDRDNIDNQLVIGSKVEAGTWNTFLHLELTSGSVSRGNADEQQWFTIMEGTMVTGDGRIVIEAEYSYSINASQILGNNAAGIDLGIRVDGVVVARSGPWGGSLRAPLQTVAAPPVGPGAHKVEAVIRIMNGNFTSTHVGGVVFARFLRR